MAGKKCNTALHQACVRFPQELLWAAFILFIAASADFSLLSGIRRPQFVERHPLKIKRFRSHHLQHACGTRNNEAFDCAAISQFKVASRCKFCFY